MDIVHQLRSRADRFSPTEKRIADACLSDIAFAASATIDQLAARAGVSRSALSRFAKAMGCGDIRALRAQLAQAGATGIRFFQDLDGADATDSIDAHDGGADDARPAGAPPALLGGILRDIDRTLRRHLHAFDAQALQAAVALLAAAPMIYAYGMGGASTIASLELQYRLVRLGRPVAAYHDPVLMRVASAALNAGQVIVALSLSGITPELLDAVRVAKRYGARVLAFAPAASPLAALADVTLPILVDETDFIYKPTAARYGILLTIDLLVTELALQAAEDSRERLRRVKLALDDYRHGGARLPLGD
ncbi:MurR/RpiR family transcriptional regulator [Robbsia sp. Bb-Pol-6]|uniref:MurR/RpiR family transcriptional regulator n=1 Tax=Robbsia betulipollinis TaxID=2981849 RepID=A0ABT3ZSD7_9BURK|nr:MurR/RpiR family transcriptional regulator [Robbsia betulipollinis]MCY0388850.1 MurR/RpiR family transcriptional regulator [Robbsia betulipollinis]